MTQAIPGQAVSSLHAKQTATMCKNFCPLGSHLLSAHPGIGVVCIARPSLEVNSANLAGLPWVWIILGLCSCMSVRVYSQLRSL